MFFLILWFKISHCVERPHFLVLMFRFPGTASGAVVTMLRIVSSTSAARRIDAAHAFLARRPPAAEVTIIGASRGAADDFVRAAARTTGATFGLTRVSLTELAARTAAMQLAGMTRVPGTQAGAEAVAARAVFDAINAGELEYFAPVASMPGFSKALARTLHELRLAGIDSIRLMADTTSESIRLTRPRQGDGGPPSLEQSRQLGHSVRWAGTGCR